MEINEYSELLKHPFWQRKRLEIFQRDDFKCVKCKDQLTNLQVHHLYYRFGTMPWDYPDDALITLCSLCHAKAEFIKYIHRFGANYLKKIDRIESVDVSEIVDVVTKRLDSNYHAESALKYIQDVKSLMSHG